MQIMSCSPAKPEDQGIFLGQGVMVGEVTNRSAIMQTRLTTSDTLVAGDLKGIAGWARFSWSLQPNLKNVQSTPWLLAEAVSDFMVKEKIEGLPEDTVIYYQVTYGSDTVDITKSSIYHFKTLAGTEIASPVQMAVVTGMNYYFHFYGQYDSTTQYQGADKKLGFPALESIRKIKPDYFIGTGDNVYFDHPAKNNYQRAIERGEHPLPGLFGGQEVTTEEGMRQKYHAQFSQPRFKELFASVATYWEKDDHDYRINDSDPYTDFPISHELGIKNFREQLPVVDPKESQAKTYRTFRMCQDLQIWLLEGRDYRSANDAPDGPEKTIWGIQQKEWLEKSLLQSDARYKCIISPTPMVGPDDAYKSDNHVNPDGFRIEGEAFFNWLLENQFSKDSLFIICGDRHWQYHAQHPSGFEEFSTGALVDANSRAGRLAGDPKSTDPEARIKQYYVQGTPEQATGGFLLVRLDYDFGKPFLAFEFFDDLGKKLYQVRK
jgi:alkaline phosphatase/alkaline phosphatase D